MIDSAEKVNIQLNKRQIFFILHKLDWTNRPEPKASDLSWEGACNAEYMSIIKLLSNILDDDEAEGK